MCTENDIKILSYFHCDKKMLPVPNSIEYGVEKICFCNFILAKYLDVYIRKTLFRISYFF